MNKAQSPSAAAGADTADMRARFRQVLSHYPTGVCVVTARSSSGQLAGMAVGSFTSASLDPPLIAFFPERGSQSWARIQAAGRFCINVLSAEQEPLSRRFAARTEDKFDGLDYRLSAYGSPVLNGAVAAIDCELAEVRDAGDHHYVLGRVLALAVESGGQPLIFCHSGYGSFAPRAERS